MHLPGPAGPELLQGAVLAKASGSQDRGLRGQTRAQGQGPGHPVTGESWLWWASWDAHGIKRAPGGSCGFDLWNLYSGWCSDVKKVEGT